MTLLTPPVGGIVRIMATEGRLATVDAVPLI